MKIVLVNTDPMVSKLIEATAKKTGIPLKSYANLKSLDIATLGQDCFVFIDEDAIQDAKQELAQIAQNFICCLLYAKTKPSEKFQYLVKKPFLPTEILDMIQAELLKVGQDLHNASDVARDEVQPLELEEFDFSEPEAKVSDLIDGDKSHLPDLSHIDDHINTINFAESKDEDANNQSQDGLDSTLDSSVKAGDISESSALDSQEGDGESDKKSDVDEIESQDLDFLNDSLQEPQLQSEPTESKNTDSDNANIIGEIQDKEENKEESQDLANLDAMLEGFDASDINNQIDEDTLESKEAESKELDSSAVDNLDFSDVGDSLEGLGLDSLESTSNTSNVDFSGGINDEPIEFDEKTDAMLNSLESKQDEIGLNLEGHIDDKDLHDLQESVDSSAHKPMPTSDGEDDLHQALDDLDLSDSPLELPEPSQAESKADSSEPNILDANEIGEIQDLLKPDALDTAHDDTHTESKEAESKIDSSDSLESLQTDDSSIFAATQSDTQDSKDLQIPLDSELDTLDSSGLESTDLPNDSSDDSLEAESSIASQESSAKEEEELQDLRGLEDFYEAEVNSEIQEVNQDTHTQDIVPNELESKEAKHNELGHKDELELPLQESQEVPQEALQEQESQADSESQESKAQSHKPSDSIGDEDFLNLDESDVLEALGEAPSHKEESKATESTNTTNTTHTESKEADTIASSATSLQAESTHKDLDREDEHLPTTPTDSKATANHQESFQEKFISELLANKSADEIRSILSGAHITIDINFSKENK